MADLDPDLVDCIRNLHDAVVTLSRACPGGGRATPALERARDAFMRFEVRRFNDRSLNNG